MPSFAEVKAALATRLGDVGLPVHVEEPAAPQPPCFTFVTTGAVRRALEVADLEGYGLRDPLGGRVFVLTLSVRLWVPIRNDELLAQQQMDTYLRAAIDATDEDRSCGGLLEDSALSSADIRFGPDQRQGQPPIVAFMAWAGAWLEAM